MTKVRDQLTAIGDRRRAARAELAATSEELAKVVPKASKEMTKLEIAAIGEISRPAIDSILKTGKADSRKT